MILPSILVMKQDSPTITSPVIYKILPDVKN